MTDQAKSLKNRDERSTKKGKALAWRHQVLPCRLGVCSLVIVSRVSPPRRWVGVCVCGVLVAGYEDSINRAQQVAGAGE